MKFFLSGAGDVNYWFHIEIEASNPEEAVRKAAPLLKKNKWDNPNWRWNLSHQVKEGSQVWPAEFNPRH